ncbi:hypothetical protein Syun_005354 [Stephania yunnanensis]|uniref:Chalcone-flavanone isomerase family protein n=1 Tax=Stephania yunnanensis TaxID=152371 RepID=A0AAP0Q1M9_9MAGN
METPSSTRRITRSKTKAAMNNNSIPNSGSRADESETQPLSRQRNEKMEQRSVLIDITNDSPITGLAVGYLETPLSQAKRRAQPKKTPGSGEILLRGQVKTLLQKVEEEAELVKLSAEHRAFVGFRDLARSPSGLLAPTPNNTPNVPNLSNNIDVEVNVGGVNGVISGTPNDAMQETLKETMMAFDESEKNLITRSLLLDFSEKSEATDSSSPCSSVLTSQGTEKSTEEDDASVWSIQVNASSIQDEDEDDEIAEVDYYDEEEEDYEECEGGDLLLDELCEGLGKIYVQEKKIPAFAGKHVRFVYNSDDELEGEVVIKDRKSAVSPSILLLKGMPTPVGKHIRFNDDEEEDEV